jgi:hypothetical protein
MIPILFVVIAAAVYWFPIRRWMNNWGTTTADLDRTMAGDSLLPQFTYSGTTGIDINATPKDIWPWLVQIGYQRGGLYSYDWLDRLFGFLDRPSAKRILPEFQQLAAGDTIPMGQGPAWPVAHVDPGRALVLDMRKMGGGLEWVWQFGLYPVDANRTRFVSRSRVNAHSIWTRLMTFMIEPSGFIMTRRMLLGIKERAEGLAASRHAGRLAA